MADGLLKGSVVLEDKKLKCLSIRDFTHELAKVLLEGGEVVLYKGRDPYRYLNIRPVKVARGGLLNEEYQERLKEASNAGQEKTLLEEI